MKKNIRVNENLNLEIKKVFNRTIVSINKEDNKIILSDLKTDAYFWSNVVFDENYIVVFSRGCMINQIPLQVEAAYNIKSDKIINVKENKKLALELEYMFVSKYKFDIATVLQAINETDLKIVDEDDIEHIIRYLTNGNKSITREEIVNYILSIYPKLFKYKNLSPSISVKDYTKILDELEMNYIGFHKMPQIIDDTLPKEKSGSKLVRKRKKTLVINHQGIDIFEECD